MASISPRALAALCALALCMPAGAGQAQASFSVHVALRQGSGPLSAAALCPDGPGFPGISLPGSALVACLPASAASHPELPGIQPSSGASSGPDPARGRAGPQALVVF